LKIQFDIQLLIDNSQKTGISITAENIIRRISEQHKNNNYVLNYFAPFNRTEKRQIIENLVSNGCIPNECIWFHANAYKLLYNFIPVPYSLFFGGDADITHFMNYYVPPGVKGKVITMVYDMVYKVYPETVNRKTLHMLNLSMEKACRRADVIITVSYFSKSEIIKYLGVPPEKIVVMPCGVDLNRFNPNYGIDEITEVKVKYGIKENYFLYLGTLEPRKNIERLIEAYSLLKKRISSAPKLVISGKRGWLYKPIFEKVGKLNIGDDIIFTDYVVENDVPLLLQGATAFIYPSLYEGFGLPPLEAMACGTPVIVSNAASLPEVVGDAALLVDPYSVESISEAMECLCLDPSLRANLKSRGLEHAAVFTWDRSVGIIADVYEQLGRRRQKR